VGNGCGLMYKAMFVPLSTSLHDSNDFTSDMTSHIYFHSFFVLIWASA